jgi:hypothetical protein
MTSQMKFYQVSMIIIACFLCGLASYFKVMYLIPIVCIGVIVVILTGKILKKRLRRKR